MKNSETFPGQLSKELFAHKFLQTKSCICEFAFARPPLIVLDMFCNLLLSMRIIERDSCTLIATKTHELTKDNFTDYLSRPVVLTN
jgi:hypothetical protein